MRLQTLFIAFALSCAAAPMTAQAQGVVRGAQEGAAEGDRAAGPIGGAVGGAIGAVTGGVAGLLGVDQRPRFREYVVRQHPAPYVYDRPVAVGAVLPETGVTYYDVPPDYGVQGYRYTVVNGQTVLVDPRTHRIIEVIE